MSNWPTFSYIWLIILGLVSAITGYQWDPLEPWPPHCAVCGFGVFNPMDYFILVGVVSLVFGLVGIGARYIGQSRVG